VRGILFLSVRNACRSQIAEAFARSILPADVPVLSAGLSPAPVDVRAVLAMAEVGFDLGAQRSKGLDEISIEDADTVVMLSPEVREVGPVFPRGIRVLHWDFDDPAASQERPERLRAAYRNVREQIRARLERFLSYEMADADRR
jgi:arsenate reductase